METFTIIVIVITLTIILFSSVSYSYVSSDPNSQIPIDMLNSKARNNTNTRPNKFNLGKVNPSASTYALYNLPEKDEYMTTDLRNQIDTLRTQYYYDNCQLSRVEPFNNAANDLNSSKPICGIPTEAQIKFDNYLISA